MTSPDRAALADELDGLAELLSKENTGSDAGFDDICQRAAAALRSPSPYSGAELPVAWTNEAQLGFLKTHQTSIPMAMWAESSQSSPIPLYAHPTLPRDAETESGEVLAQEVHRVAGCQVGSERCKNIIRWYRGKLAQRGPRDAEREPFAWVVLSEQTGNTRMWTRNGDIAKAFAAKHLLECIELYRIAPVPSSDAERETIEDGAEIVFLDGDGDQHRIVYDIAEDHAPLGSGWFLHEDDPFALPSVPGRDAERETLRKLVDIVWNEATESTAVPSTKWADKLIDRALALPSIPPPESTK